MSLTERIAAEIATSGPMPFDRFMEFALYDSDDGYFTAGQVRSERSGDFLTSPEVSPWFGKTIARFVSAERDRVGTPFTIVEAGAGTGSLLRPLLDELDPAPDAVIAVEVSRAAKASLTDQVPEATVVDDLPGEPFTGVIIANELLDNLPAAIAVRRGDSWTERVVAVDADGALTYDEVEPRAEVAAWADQYGQPVADGGLVEVQLAATAWVREAVGLLSRGALIVIDYGETAEDLEHRRPEGTLRTYRGHHLGPDPLLEPGSTDITMDVNVSALVAAAEEAGADVTVHRQDEFLAEWGLLADIQTLRQQEHEAAASGNTMAQLTARSERTAAEALIHPRGLGDFRVVLARAD